MNLGSNTTTPEVIEPRGNKTTSNNGMQFGVELEGPAIHIDAPNCTSPIAAFMEPRGLPWLPRVRPLGANAYPVGPRTDKEAAMRVDGLTKSLCKERLIDFEVGGRPCTICIGLGDKVGVRGPGTRGEEFELVNPPSIEACCGIRHSAAVGVQLHIRGNIVHAGVLGDSVPIAV